MFSWRSLLVTASKISFWQIRFDFSLENFFLFFLENFQKSEILKIQACFGEDEWKATLECIRRIKTEGDHSNQGPLKKMVEQELVHAIEAVLNSKKPTKKEQVNLLKSKSTIL